jgi:hypothetical protein
VGAALAEVALNIVNTKPAKIPVIVRRQNLRKREGETIMAPFNFEIAIFLLVEPPFIVFTNLATYSLNQDEISV